MPNNDHESVRKANAHEDKEQGSHYSVATNPPTRIITVKDHFTISDQNEMLALAQRKFDELRQRRRVLASSSSIYGRGGGGGKRKMRGETKESLKVSQLLSSLLYLSLMMNKVDDMKKILEARDPTLYNEWRALLDSLHSPLFHLRERRIHNERAQKIFRRKSKYKELYEETRSSLLKLEDTSKEMSHSISKLSEENLKCQHLLEAKNEVEKNLAVATNEISSLKEQIQRSNENLSAAASETSNLRSTLKDLEIEKARLLQQLEDNADIASKKAVDMEDLKTTLETKLSEIQTLTQRIGLLESEQDTLERKLIQEADGHAKILEDKERQLSECKENIENQAKALEEISLDKSSTESIYRAEKKRLEESLTKANTAAKVAQAEVKNISKDLESKSVALTEALESIRLGKISEGKLQDMITTKDAQMKDLHESQKKVEIELLEAQNITSSMEEGELETAKLRQKLSEFEDEIENHKVRQKEIASDLETAENNESKLQIEKDEYEILVSELKDDLKSKLDECGRLEELRSSQKLSSDEYQVQMDSKERQLVLEVSNLKSEKSHLQDMMDMLKGDLEKSEGNAQKSQETTDSKFRELHDELMSTKLNLTKAETETKVLRNSQSILEGNILAKPIQNEKDSSAMQSSIDDINIQNSKMSKTVESIQEVLMNDLREALEKQKLAEIKAATYEEKAASLQLQLEKLDIKKTNPINDQDSARKEGSELLTAVASGNPAITA